MIRRYGGPQTPPLMGGMTESRDDTSGRRAEANGREPRDLLEYGRGDGWGWDQGELVCPLSWLRTKNRSHGQHLEERCDEA